VRHASCGNRQVFVLEEEREGFRMANVNSEVTDPILAMIALGRDVR
jgi:hypothetical protein